MAPNTKKQAAAPRWLKQRKTSSQASEKGGGKNEGSGGMVNSEASLSLEPSAFRARTLASKGSPPQASTPPLTNVENPATSPLGLCEGDCDSDADCQGNLKCFLRGGFTPVPGCSSDGLLNWDYCYDDGSTLGGGKLVNVANPPSSPLGECEGDCDSDDDCQGNLKCFIRRGNTAVPGCGSAGGFPEWDYCYDDGSTPAPMQPPSPPPTLLPTEPPTFRPTVTPTPEPTPDPTQMPTPSPTQSPTPPPTAEPSQSPTPPATTEPSQSPTPPPTTEPTLPPTPAPTSPPTASPTSPPTRMPTVSPTEDPTAGPTAAPSSSPTAMSTPSPTSSPTTTQLVSITPDCPAIAAGTATTDADSESFIVDMDLTVQNDFSFDSFATSFQSELQKTVAPGIAGCEETGGRLLQNGATKIILNVLFGEPVIDPEESCTPPPGTEDVACYATDTRVDVYYVEESISRRSAGNSSDLESEIENEINDALQNGSIQVPGLVDVGGVDAEPQDGSGIPSGVGKPIDSQSSDSSGLEPGGIVGITLSVLVVLLLAAFLIGRRRKKSFFQEFDDGDIHVKDPHNETGSTTNNIQVIPEQGSIAAVWTKEKMNTDGAKSIGVEYQNSLELQYPEDELIHAGMDAYDLAGVTDEVSANQSSVSPPLQESSERNYITDDSVYL